MTNGSMPKGNVMVEARAAIYARVSTSTHGQDVNNQIEPARAFAAARGFHIAEVYADIGVSGAKESREGLDQMVKDARVGKFKNLIVMEISRLARDLRHLLNLLHDLNQVGVQVISIREGIEFGSTMGQAMVGMIGILAAVERDLLRERIRSALAVKKQDAERTGNGWRCGRPPAVDAQLKDRIVQLRGQGLSIRKIELAIERRVSRTTIERVPKVQK